MNRECKNQKYKTNTQYQPLSGWSIEWGISFSEVPPCWKLLSKPFNNTPLWLKCFTTCHVAKFPHLLLTALKQAPVSQKQKFEFIKLKEKIRLLFPLTTHPTDPPLLPESPIKRVSREHLGTKRDVTTCWTKLYCFLFCLSIFVILYFCLPIKKGLKGALWDRGRCHKLLKILSYGPTVLLLGCLLHPL